jgi:hypothetical protein
MAGGNLSGKLIPTGLPFPPADTNLCSRFQDHLVVPDTHHIFFVDQVSAMHPGKRMLRQFFFKPTQHFGHNYWQSLSIAINFAVIATGFYTDN